MKINTNINSLVAINKATDNNVSSRSSLEKLSSGLRVNAASDDASGLVIADKLRTQKNSLEQGIDNANSAVAMMQIADKAMAEQSNILDIVKVKLVQATTATTTDEGRSSIAKDINKLLIQLDAIASQTNYNGVNLLQSTQTNSSATASLSFQVGERSNNTISTAGSVQANTSGLSNLSGIKTVVATGAISAAQARGAMAQVDEAISELNVYRADFGSTQSQIESATRSLLVASTNIATAESVIRDVDYASETANFNKVNVIIGASSYAQSQANAMSQNVLQLLS